MTIREKLRWSTPEEEAKLIGLIYNTELDDLFCYKMNDDLGCKNYCRKTKQCEFQFTSKNIEMFLWLLQQDEKILERGFLNNE